MIKPVSRKLTNIDCDQNHLWPKSLVTHQLRDQNWQIFGPDFASESSWSKLLVRWTPIVQEQRICAALPTYNMLLTQLLSRERYKWTSIEQHSSSYHARWFSIYLMMGRGPWLQTVVLHLRVSALAVLPACFRIRLTACASAQLYTQQHSMHYEGVTERQTSAIDTVYVVNWSYMISTGWLQRQTHHNRQSRRAHCCAVFVLTAPSWKCKKLHFDQHLTQDRLTRNYGSKYCLTKYLDRNQISITPSIYLTEQSNILKNISQIPSFSAHFIREKTRTNTSKKKKKTR